MNNSLQPLAARLLAADHRQGGLLSIALLREAAALPPDQFDAALVDLVTARAVDLYPVDYIAGLTAEDSASYFHAAGQVFNALSLR